MDELCLSVELKEAQAGPDASLPEAAVLLCLEPEGVPSLEGLPQPEEAYELRIEPAGVLIRAAAPHGLFNGAISLMQLLPPCAPLSGSIPLDCMQARRQPPNAQHACMLLRALHGNRPLYRTQRLACSRASPSQTAQS
jgi:hypothetical protein